MSFDIVKIKRFNRELVNLLRSAHICDIINIHIYLQ